MLNLEKRRHLPHYCSDKDFKGTVVNRALTSYHGGIGGSLEITLTVLLIKTIFIKKLIKILRKKE